MQKRGTDMSANLQYLTSCYDEKIKKIRELHAPLNFLFITDMHNRLHEMAFRQENPDNPKPFELAANAIQSIQYILDRCPEISFVVSGGDIGNDYAPDPDRVRASHQEVMDALYRLSVPVHCCIGNHDDAIGNAIDRGDDTRPFAILPAEMHRLCMKYNPTRENYYYCDLHTSERDYRAIFLNTSDRPYYTDENGQQPFGWRDEISDAQAVWLENEALATDRTVLVFSHAPLSNKGIFGTQGMPNPIKPYDDLLNGPRVQYAVRHAPNTVMLIAGHVHYDNLLYDHGLLSVTTLSAFAQEWAPSSPVREIGTVTETAFDVFSIKGSTVYITRFGAGSDRIGYLPKL